MNLRWVKGFEKRYAISECGKVLSMRAGRFLKPYPFSNGYLGVQLGSRNVKLVHRLVAEAFIEGDSTLQVNHKDGDRKNNHVLNLEWMTCSENHKHSYRQLSRKKHALTRQVELSDGQSTQLFESGLAAAKALGVVAGSVASAAINNHKCKGYGVRYV